MSRVKGARYLVIIFLLLISLACSVSATPKKTPEAASGDVQDGSGQIQPDTSAAIQPDSSAAPVIEKAPTTPVGINEGLSSLNSYTYSVQIITSGPTPQDKNDMRVTTSYTSNGDNTKTQNVTVSSSAEDPEESRSSTTNYRVGGVTCTVDDTGESETETDEYTPAQKEIINIVSNLTDTVINVENPVLVGTETIGGVNCNHYTFNVAGLGMTSGAEVTQSNGEFWSAVDGNYLVKYDVALETRNAPESSANADVLTDRDSFPAFRYQCRNHH